jgi:hypothetical protein
MNSFIKLTSGIINKYHIIHISKLQSSYKIYLQTNDFSGFLIMSTGFLSSNHNIINICEKNNKQDYDTITNFIEEIK